MDNLAIAIFHQDRHAEAEQLYQQLLEIQRRVLRREHLQTLSSMNNLAVAIERQGRHAEVERLKPGDVES
jgi:hypothetical protein